MKVISISNQKGGVGKTSTTLCLADALRKKGKKVLIIDNDPQCNASSAMLAKTEDTNTMYDVFFRTATLNDSIQTTTNGDIIPNDLALMGIESQFTANPGNFMLMKSQMTYLNYDYVIIDTPPNYGFYSSVAWIASDYIIIPVRADKFAMDGLKIILGNINNSKAVNPSLQILGVLQVVYDVRTKLDRETREGLPVIGKQENIPIFKTAIRTCQQLKEAQSQSMNISDYAPGSNATKDFMDLADEIEKEI